MSEHSPGKTTDRARISNVNKWHCRDIILFYGVKTVQLDVEDYDKLGWG